MGTGRRSFLYLCLGLWGGSELSAQDESIREGLLQGGLLLREGKAEQAAKKWEESLASKSIEDVLRMQMGIALSYSQTGRYRDAIVVYRRLLRTISLHQLNNLRDWQVGVSLALSRCEEELGEPEQAERSYREVLRLTGTNRQWIAHRCTARLGLARSLVARERSREAIAVLTDSLPELAGRKWSGWRAKQMAMLARIYYQIGERDWAVTILERLEEDEEIAERFFHLATRLAEGQPKPKDERKEMRVYRSSLGFDVVMPGRFELRFRQPDITGAALVGWIAEWYHIENDPFCTTDLSGSSEPLVSLPAARVGEKVAGEWKPMSAEVRRKQRGRLMLRGDTLELLEDSQARVRIRSRQHGWPHAIVEHTIYPSGRVAIAVQGERADELVGHRLDSLQVSMHRRRSLNWREVGKASWLMSGELEGILRASYLRAERNVVPSYHLSQAQNVMLIPAETKERSLKLKQSQEARSLSFELDLEERARWQAAFLLELAPEDGSVSARQYREPGTVTPQDGKIVRGDPGDWNGDGFNEGEGCFVLRGSSKFSLKAGSAGLQDPAIKILAPKGQGLSEILVNGSLVGEAARVGLDAILVSWRGSLKAGQAVEVELR